MRKLFASAHARLIGRGVLAGALTTITLVQQADDPFSSGVWKGAIIAGGWVVVESITPLNAVIGWFKQPT